MPLFASQLQGVAPVRSLAAPSASSQAVPGLRPRTCSCPGRSRQPPPVVCGAATVESSLAASTSQPVHILAPCAAGRLIYGGTVSRFSTCAPPASRWQRGAGERCRELAIFDGPLALRRGWRSTAFAAMKWDRIRRRPSQPSPTSCRCGLPQLTGLFVSLSRQAAVQPGPGPCRPLSGACA